MADYYPPNYSEFLNVRAFGAKGDAYPENTGVGTDDTAAFEAAIAVALRTGKPIYVPAGVYAVNKLVVTVPIVGDPQPIRPFAMYGESSGTSILKLRSSQNDALLTIQARQTTDPDDQQSAKGVSLRDLCFDGNGNQQTGSNYPVVRFRDLAYAEFTRLHVVSGRFRGIDDLGRPGKGPSGQGVGDTPASRNHYTDIRVTSSANATRDEGAPGIFLENTKFYVLNNLIIDNWGAGLVIRDSGTALVGAESGGFTNINGLTVLGCPGDGLRLESAVWISVNGFACMACGYALGTTPTDGVPLRLTSNDPDGDPVGPGSQQSVFTNLVFRADRNEAILIEKGTTNQFIVIADAMIVNGRQGVRIRNADNVSLANMTFLDVGNDVDDEGDVWNYAIQVQDEESVRSSRVTASNIQFYRCGGGLALEGTTEQFFAENVQFWNTPAVPDPNKGEGPNNLNAVDIASTVGYARINLWGGNAPSNKFVNASANAIVHFNGGTFDLSDEYRVSGDRVVASRKATVNKVTLTGTPHQNVIDLKDAVNAIIDRLRVTDGHGLIQDPP